MQKKKRARGCCYAGGVGGTHLCGWCSGYTACSECPTSWQSRHASLTAAAYRPWTQTGTSLGSCTQHKICNLGGMYNFSQLEWERAWSYYLPMQNTMLASVDSTKTALAGQIWILTYSCFKGQLQRTTEGITALDLWLAIVWQLLAKTSSLRVLHCSMMGVFEKVAKNTPWQQGQGQVPTLCERGMENGKEANLFALFSPSVMLPDAR